MKTLRFTVLAILLAAGLVACSGGDDSTGKKATFVVLNQTPFEVFAVWVAPSTDTECEWGDDRLGDDTLSPGGSTRFDLDECDVTFDMVASPLNQPDPNAQTNAVAFDQFIACNSEFTFTVTD